MTTMTEQASTIEPMSLAEIAKEHGDDGVTNREAVFQVSDLSVSYSGNVAIRDVTLDVYQQRRHGLHRPVRLRQEHADPLLQPHERPRAGRECRGRRPLPRQAISTRADVDPVEVRRRIGMVFQKPNPFPKSIYDNIAFGPRVLGMKGDLDERVERALQRAALWDEVKDRLKEIGARPLRRPAAAALHRALPRRRAGRDPDGRAGLGARPDLDDADRGPDARAQARVHDRDRHAQHAAGRARRRHDRVLLGRRRLPTAASARASSSSTTRRRRSSRRRPTSGPRTT